MLKGTTRDKDFQLKKDRFRGTYFMTKMGKTKIEKKKNLNKLTVRIEH